MLSITPTMTFSIDENRAEIESKALIFTASQKFIFNKTVDMDNPATGETERVKLWRNESSCSWSATFTHKNGLIENAISKSSIPKAQ